jgi:hypothetical protein
VENEQLDKASQDKAQARREGTSMGYFNRSEVEVGAWTQVRGDGAISYHVCTDEVEVSFGSPPVMQLVLDARALRRCADSFTAALTDLRAAEERRARYADDDDTEPPIAE